MAGCHATVFSPSPADKLRQQAQELEAKNVALESQVEELRAQLAIKSEAATKTQFVQGAAQKRNRGSSCAVGETCTFCERA
jgi:outer membrane murein-binding lipoprotein Lpp